MGGFYAPFYKKVVSKLPPLLSTKLPLAVQKDKPDKPDKPDKHKPYFVYRIRIYIIDGAYNGELIEEFDFKSPDIRDFRGNSVRDPKSELNNKLEYIGKHGYFLDTGNGGQLYYPPHRIYYIEVEENNT